MSKYEYDYNQDAPSRSFQKAGWAKQPSQQEQSQESSQAPDLLVDVARKGKMKLDPGHGTAMTFGAGSHSESRPDYPAQAGSKQQHPKGSRASADSSSHLKLKDDISRPRAQQFKPAAPAVKQNYEHDDFDEDPAEDADFLGTPESHHGPGAKWNQSSIDHKTEVSNNTGSNITALFPQKRGREERQANKVGQSDQMYEQLYHEMMAGTAQGDQGQRLVQLHPRSNPFDNYKTQWNNYQSKQDPSYQRQLRKIHRDSQKRFESYSKERERTTLEQQKKKARDEELDYQKTCTFSPQLRHDGPPGSFSNASAAGKISSKSQQKFYKQEQAYLKRKEGWRNEILQKQHKIERRMSKTKFMTQASQEIWDGRQSKQGSSVFSGFSATGSDFNSPPRGNGPFSEDSVNCPRELQKRVSSTGSSKSRGHMKSQFLQRNLYSIKEHKQKVSKKAKQDYDHHMHTLREQEFKPAKASTTRKKGASTISSMSKQSYSRGGSIHSSGSSSTGKKSGRRASKFHQPFISPKSSELGAKVRNKSKKNVFRALVDDAFEKDLRKAEAQKKKEEHHKILKRQHHENLQNQNSEQALAHKFKQRFDKVWNEQLQQGTQLYLIDIVEDLQLVHNEEMSQSFKRVDELLQQQHISLLIDVERENKKKAKEIHNNLLQVCLAIISNRTRYEEHELLEDQILRLYLSKVSTKAKGREQYLVDQIMCMKHLVNRKAFSLSGKQVKQIHAKFMNFSEVRRNIMYKEKTRARQDQVLREEQKRNPGKPELIAVGYRGHVPAQARDSRAYGQGDRSRGHSRSSSKSPLGHSMYERAMMQKEAIARKRADGLRQKDEEELRGATFSPRTNTKSGSKSYGKSRATMPPRSSQKKEQSARPQGAEPYQEQFQPLTNEALRLPFPVPHGSLNNSNREDRSDHAKRQSEPQEDFNEGQMQDFLDRDPVSSNMSTSYQKPQAAVPVPQYPSEDEFKPRPPQRDPRPDIRDRPRRETSMTKRLLEPSTFLPTVEEPICVLKIELDGENIEEIKVFENDDPKKIVDDFGMKFNLSSNAKKRLLEQINDQIQMEDDSY